MRILSAHWRAAGGARHDPVALADGKLFVQGLFRTEEIESRLRALLSSGF
ncbi:MAG: hypothetical protein V4446_06440 [Pseudomonadota bacterium]